MKENVFYEKYKDKKNVVVLSGAGISTAAGVSAFRQGGKDINPRIQHISHASRYGNHLDELWESWGQRFRTMRNAKPTAAHIFIKQWEEILKSNGGSLTVITQNVDGLHGEDAIEIHGSFTRTRCIQHHDHIFPTPEESGVPISPICGSQRTRPDVVLFGERLSKKKINESIKAVKNADLIVVVGTSGNVFPVADWPRVGKDHGATVVLVNNEPWSDNTVFDEWYSEDIQEILSPLV